MLKAVAKNVIRNRTFAWSKYFPIRVLSPDMIHRTISARFLPKMYSSKNIEQNEIEGHSASPL
jgi:hypothetical protein